LAGQPFQILYKKSKSRPCKNLASLNLESGTTLFAKKGKKGENELRQSPNAKRSSHLTTLRPFFFPPNQCAQVLF